MRHSFALAVAAGAFLASSAFAQSAQPTTAMPSAQAAAPAPASIAGLQFLYGSGEAAALSRQTYAALEAYALAQVAHRPADSVILAQGATLAAPAYAPCGDKPLAAVFDIDETVILNAGNILSRARGPGTPRDDTVWPVPGAVEALRALKAAGITVIYNTNRTTNMTDGVIANLLSVGLDAPVHGETLFLNGDDALRGNKDGRRATIAAKWCVVAMAGDQLGDFSEMFNHIDPVAERRRVTVSGSIGANWGRGWFTLPNTAYGTALEGALDEIFPAAGPAANDR
jgi:phosphoglycolate phosphatase-like HAD superfamily hydrolase